MSWVGVGVAGAGVVTGLIGQQQAAGAAQGAAGAQADMAGQMRRDILGEVDLQRRETLPLADATPMELAALSRSYDASSRQLDREERLMAAIDPALMEASKQALGLLRGDNAAANNPLMQQRQSQRAQLLDSLRSQYGPGAENTSIGQRALQQFDMESNSMFQQNQQNSLAQMFGIAGTDIGGRNQRAISGLQAVGQGYSALQERKLSSALNLGGMKIGALSGTSQQMIDAAGAPFVGQAMQGQGLASLGGNIMQTGAYLGGKGFGQTGTTTGQPGGASTMPFNKPMSSWE